MTFKKFLDLIPKNTMLDVALIQPDAFGSKIVTELWFRADGAECKNLEKCIVEHFKATGRNEIYVQLIEK